MPQRNLSCERRSKERHTYEPVIDDSILVSVDLCDQAFAKRQHESVLAAWKDVVNPDLAVDCSFRAAAKPRQSHSWRQFAGRIADRLLDLCLCHTYGYRTLELPCFELMDHNCNDSK